MATIITLLAASCVTLHAQMKDEMTLDAFLAKLEAFPEQPARLQANLVAVMILTLLLLIKVGSIE